MSIRVYVALWISLVSAMSAVADESQSNRKADDAPRQIEEVVITAERRESSLQKTPIAVAVFNDQFLEQGNITDVQNLAPFAPGLNYTQVSNFAQLNIRGIGLEQINLGGEPGVALHQDGVYIARPFVNNAVFLDVDRVEVVRGPQGTLYGRNATGGSINLVSNRPTDTFESEVSTLFGNYGRARFTGMASGPLSDDGAVRGRVALVSDQRDGYLKNHLGGSDLEDDDTYSGRGEIAFDVSDSIEVGLSGDYMRADNTGPMFRTGDIGGTAPALGGRVDGDPWKIYIDGSHDQNIHDWGTTGRVTWHGESVSLTSLTAYRDSKFRLKSDLDGTDFFLNDEDLEEKADQFSQEFQLASNGDAPLSWIVGAYYFHENGRLNYDFDIPPLATVISFHANQDTTAYALFGDATYRLTDKWSVTAGLRYSDERKDAFNQQTFFVVGTASVDDDWSAVTPRFVVSYQVNDDTLSYFSVSKGFKSGGINTGSTQSNAYDPEYIWNYELGLKSRAFDGRLQANLAAFFYQYDDLQVTQYAVGQAFIDNAAKAEGWGFEAEVTAYLTDQLSINATLAYIDTQFTNYQSLDSFRPELGVLDLDGNELPRAPNLTSSLIARYEIPMGRWILSLQGEYLHRDEQYFTAFNTDYAEGGQYDLINTRVSFAPQDGRWTFAAYGQNLTDEEYEMTETVSGINAGTLVLYGAPLTYGLEARFRF